MKNILVPTDFSSCANNALSYAIVLAKEFSAKLTIVTAYYVPSAGGASILVDLQDDLRESSEKQLRELGDKIKAENPLLDLSLFANYSTPINTVLQVIKEKDVDVVVMGTTGATGAKEVFIGSTTASLISKIKVPIFAIPENYTKKELKKIFLATDLVNIKESNSLGFIKKIAKMFKSKIEILNVAEKPNSQESFDMVAEAIEMDNVFAGIEHHFNFIQSTDIEGAILDFVDNNNNNSVIAVINRERGFFERLFHTSISKKLAMHAKVPILILHE